MPKSQFNLAVSVGSNHSIEFWLAIEGIANLIINKSMNNIRAKKKLITLKKLISNVDTKFYIMPLFVYLLKEQMLHLKLS